MSTHTCGQDRTDGMSSEVGEIQNWIAIYFLE